MNVRNPLLAGIALAILASSFPASAADAVRTFRFGTVPAEAPAFGIGEGAVLGHLDGKSASSVAIPVESAQAYANAPSAVTLAVVAGELPPGAALEGKRIVLKPFVPEGRTYSFTIEATNAAGVRSRRTLTMTSDLPDTTPDAFVLSATNAAEAAAAQPGATVASAATTPTGFVGTVDVVVAGGEASTDGGATWGTTRQLTAGGSFRVRLVAPTAFSTTATATVRVGTGEPTSFSVTTRAIDLEPDVIAFAPQTGVASATVVLSEIRQLTGHDGVDVSATNGSYRLCSRVDCSDAPSGWTTAKAKAAAGSYVQARVTSGAVSTTVTATLSYGTRTTAFAVTTRPAISLATATMPDSAAYKAWSYNFSTLLVRDSSSTATATYASANKPSWATIASAGLMSGTPTAAGTFAFTVTASAGGATASQSYTLTVSEALRIVAPSVTTVPYDTDWNYAFATTGGYGARTYSVTPALPTGVSIDATNGSLRGYSPGATGTQATYVVKVTDSSGTAQAQIIPDVSPPSSNLYAWGGYKGTVPVMQAPVDLVGLETGFGFNCGLRSNGTYTCFQPGSANEYGQFGDGTGTWSSLAPGYNHACGVKTDGTGWCWGYNGYGQLGTGNTTNSKPPVQVAGGGTWKKISSNAYTVCGIKSDDRLYCWGENYEGSAGLGGLNSIGNAPTALSGSWKDVRLFVGRNGCGVRTDGSGWCWGNNQYGQAGTGGTGAANVPSAVAGGNSFAKIVGTGYTTCGLLTNGSVKCWGYAGKGGIGNGAGTASTGNVLTPTLVGGNHSFVDVAGGNGDPGQFCAIDGDGVAWCWGGNSYGSLGDGTRTDRDLPTQVSSSVRFKQVTMMGVTPYAFAR